MAVYKLSGPSAFLADLLLTGGLLTTTVASLAMLGAFDPEEFEVPEEELFSRAEFMQMEAELRVARSDVRVLRKLVQRYREVADSRL